MNRFYEDNHRQYFHSTVAIDPTAFLSPLAQFLNPGAKIFDIGCGSGRDLLWFKGRGFQVVGFEQSPSLAALAREHAGCQIIEGDYLHYDFSGLQVDAVVMIGALVHQPRDVVPEIIESIGRSLKIGGYFLITMKEGTGRISRPDKREFTLWRKEEVEAMYRTCGLNIIDFSRQVSRLRADDVWLGHVLRMTDGD